MNRQLSGRRPNIVFIIADDHQHDAIHALGNQAVQTPSLDRLAASGTVFRNTNINGGTSGAVCAPCRACVHTGNPYFQATVSGTLQDDMNNITMRPENALLPAVMREHGYRTFATGKWHNDFASFNRCFQGGENIFFGGMSDHDQVPVHDYDPEGHYTPEQRQVKAGFSSELFTESAIAFIEEEKEDEPFFLYVAYTAPHDPRTPPAPYDSMYDPDEITLPDNFLPEHPFDHGARDIRGEYLAAQPRQPEEIRRHIADYYGMITHMDAQIGRLMTALEKNGQADNTIIVYTSDHGLALGRHGLMAKQCMYEHSIRVPWMMKGPGIEAGLQLDDLCYQFDIFPTLCESVGLQVPDSVRGISHYSVMRDRGRTQPIRGTVYSLYRDVQRGIKDERWKLILYRKSPVTGQGCRETQLFDLLHDPCEMNNLAGDHQYAYRIARLHEQLRSTMNAFEDPYRHLFQ
ncbi:sulfatase-like hydrolase/transferase [Paenibacillus chungangensis]|uniref:Sulfatase-like hydrolase/transferase n=1 Tax=Paenibacillus chungangensis TaxID=696535 RepID=A0ABW3HSR5_9BACL